MVNYSAALDTTFAALADPTRRAILARLSDVPEASVTELARPFRMSLPAVSKHLRVLEDAGLLARRREGRTHHCRIEPRPMRDAARWMAETAEFWQGRLDALARYLAETAEEKTPWTEPSRPPHAASPKPGRGSRARSRPRATGSSARGRSRS